MEAFTRYRWLKALFWRPWVRIVSTLWTLYGVFDFMNGKIISKMPTTSAWRVLWDRYYVLPSLSWQTWVVVLLVIAIVAAGEGGFRFVRALQIAQQTENDKAAVAPEVRIAKLTIPELQLELRTLTREISAVAWGNDESPDGRSAREGAFTKRFGRAFIQLREEALLRTGRLPPSLGAVTADMDHHALMQPAFAVAELARLATKLDNTHP